MPVTLDRDALAKAAENRGLALSGLFAAAGVSRKTMAKVNRGEPVRATIAARLNAALAQIPETDHLVKELAS